MKHIKSKMYRDIHIDRNESIMTGVDVFDKFISEESGIYRGYVILLTGTSGAGKTTLATCIQKWCSPYRTSAYFREAPKSQTKKQTKYLKLDDTENAFAADISDIPDFEEYLIELDNLKPDIVFIDSLQAIAKEDYDIKNIMSETDACYYIITTLKKWAEKNMAVVVIIGHNTKGESGDFAGKNTIVQMPDAHLVMVHHKSKGGYRTIEWGQKNRMGGKGILYYTIGGENGIDFITEEEFKSNGETKTLNEVLIDSISKHLNTIFCGDKKGKDKLLKTIGEELWGGGFETDIESTIGVISALSRHLK